MKAKIYPLSNLEKEVVVTAAPFCLHLEIICASLAKGKTTIKNVINSKDLATTISWCRALGATIKKETDKIIIKGIDNKISFKNSLFTCENIVTAKLMIPVLCSVSQPFGVKSKPAVIEQIRQFTYVFDAYNIKYYFEDEMIRFEKVMEAKEVEFDGDLDIYVAAGILLALPMLDKNSTFKLRAPKRCEKTYDTICKIVKSFRVDIKHPATMRYEINGNQKYKACTITTEKDNFLLSHNALLTRLLDSNDVIKLLNYRRNSTMDDIKLLNFVRKNVVDYKNYVFSRIYKKKIFNFNKIDLNCENSLPLLMVIASVNENDTMIGKVDFNKDRIKQQYSIMENAFDKLEIGCKKLENEVIISKKEVDVKKQIESKKDPFVVIALTYLALISKAPIVIKNVECVFDVYLDFFENIKTIGGVVEFIHD